MGDDNSYYIDDNEKLLDKIKGYIKKYEKSMSLSEFIIAISAFGKYSNDLTLYSDFYLVLSIIFHL